MHSEYANSFLICQITVGRMAIGVQAGDVPASIFATKLDKLAQLDALLAENGLVEIKIDKVAEALLGEALTLPVTCIGQDVRMTIRNIGLCDAPFYAAILGEESTDRFASYGK